jgi:serralysin
VVVGNSSGSVTSSAATLSVNSGGPASGGIASDCTLFASSSGNDANSGTSATAPKTFSGAAAATRPGSVLCLLAGTYNLSSGFDPPTNGSSAAWIVYKSYGDGPVNFVWTGAADASPMVRLGASGTAFPNGPSYLEFRGLNFDGRGNAGDAFYCRGGHHLRFIANSMSNTGGSGIGSRGCDYLTSDHNVVDHCGYMPASTSVPQWYGWSSGISYNSDQYFDTYAGFHNVIANNIVVGEYDSSSNHTDGNGIILDLSNGSYSASTANTPPVLIINNVVYGNGGRCIESYVVTNFWVVNNTCYKNNLDASLGNAGSFSTNNSHDGHYINNIAVAWDSGNPTYTQEGTGANIGYAANLMYGSSPNFAPSAGAGFIQGDPLFMNPPSLTGGQYATALAPSLLGSGLMLLPASPAIGKGIDPTTLPNLPTEIVNDLKAYAYTDINGKARPQGGGVDLGAYQH